MYPFHFSQPFFFCDTNKYQPLRGRVIDWDGTSSNCTNGLFRRSYRTGNRPYSRRLSHVVSQGGKQKKKLPMRVAAVEFVYSLKMRQLFQSCKKVIGSIVVFSPIVPFDPVLRVASRWPIVPNLTKQTRNSKNWTYHTLLR